MRVDYHHLPKVELHLHLDCCLSYKLVQQLNPGISEAEYRDSFIAPPKCTDLADYITRAIKGFELMQTPEQLRLVTLDLFEQLKNDNVVYAEMRFAPLQHIYKGLLPEEVVSIVNNAVQEGIETYGVEARILLCTLRHYTAEQSMETVALVQKFKDSYVAGFDIAADEAGFPIDNHIRAFEYARAHGLNCTAHAGEAKGAASVWETLSNFRPSRIGHGVRSIEDPKLLDFLLANDIHLEVCPTSNIQVNVFDRIELHSVDQLYKKGVSISINTDARTISDTTLAKEYQLLERVFQWKKQQFLHCNLEAIKHAFVSDAIKTRIARALENAYS